jgi:hypothetical protein
MIAGRALHEVQKVQRHRLEEDQEEDQAARSEENDLPDSERAGLRLPDWEKDVVGTFEIDRGGVMTKWEYKHISIGNLAPVDAEYCMDCLGREGWELVQVVGVPTSNVTAWFKRPLPDYGSTETEAE